MTSQKHKVRSLQSMPDNPNPEPDLLGFYHNDFITIPQPDESRNRLPMESSETHSSQPTAKSPKLESDSGIPEEE